MACCIPPETLQALVTACERLLANPKLRFALGQSAANTIRNQHTWDRNVERIVELGQFTHRRHEPFHLIRIA